MKTSSSTSRDAASPAVASFRAARLGGALGLAVGLVAGGFHLAHNPWVREFQAGAGSPLSERLAALAQRVTVESLGFGLLAALAALLALVVSGRETRRDPDRLAGRSLEAFGAVVLWVTAGAWVGDALLPLLSPGGLLALGAGGILASFVGLRLLHPVLRLLPGARRTPHAATALAGVLAVLAAAHWGLLQLFRSGERTPLRWGLALGGAVLALTLAGPLSAVLAGSVRSVGRRLRRGRLLARPAGLAGTGLFAVCLGTTLVGLELSPLPSELEYAPLESDLLPGRPNVILVTIDTLRADHLGCYGYDRPTSPFLDSLATGGARFADPVAPASWTKPSTATILTGLHPSRHGALHHGSRLVVPEGERTLAEAFRDAGYATAGFVTNPNVKKVFDFDRGFDEYFDSFVEDTVTLAAVRNSLFGQVLVRLSRHQFNWKYENDVLQMNRFIVPWLERNRDERFFLYLHYIDPHTPYHPPKQYREEFRRDSGFALHNERKRRVGIDLYDGEIRYVDDGLSRLAEDLRRLGLWEETLVAITSDHGEEFFEHGYDGHGFSLYQPVVRVPLLLHGPGIPAGHVVQEPVQIVDLPATLLELAGATDGAGRLGDGESFAPLLFGGQADVGPYFLESEFGMGQDEHRSFVFRGVRDGAFKLVRTEENEYFPEQAHIEGGLALYDLERDPHEQRNLIRDERYRELVDTLLDQLLRHAEFLDREGADPSSAPLSDSLKEDLEALGYL